jgi:hypothetical protein
MRLSPTTGSGENYLREETIIAAFHRPLRDN